jgi:hypothetical protein
MGALFLFRWPPRNWFGTEVSTMILALAHDVVVEAARAHWVFTAHRFGDEDGAARRQ